MSESLLRVEELVTAFSVGGAEVPVLNGLSFECRSGDIVGVVGESGSGKSVLALSLLRLIRPPGRIVSGRISLEGRDVLTMSNEELAHVRGGEIGIVFQDAGGSFTPVYSVGDQIVETIRAHLSLDRSESHNRAVSLLSEVGIPEPERRMKNLPHELSGGMKQRVAIALALACEPKVLIADDPTSAVDVTIQAQILKLLGELMREKGRTLILISHDFRVVSTICQKVLILYSGDIVEHGLSHEVFLSPQHPYTRALMDCAPTVDEYRFPFAILPGSPPALIEGRLPGCSFHPRCPRRVDMCSTRMPAETTLGVEHAYRCWNPEPQGDQRGPVKRDEARLS